MFLSRLIGGRSPRAETSSGWWQPLLDAGYIRLARESEPQSGEAALSYHAWYRAIALIAQKVAAVPKHLLRRTGSPPNEGKERARDHTVYKLVNERANSEQTAFQFWLQMAGHVPSRGNGYAAIWRERGVVTELIPMDPDRTYPVRYDGQLWYVVYPFGHQGDGIKIRPEDVLHFRGFGFDGICGYPVWSKAAEEIGLAKSQRKLEAARYKNSGRPAMLLQTDAKLNDATRERLRADWERMHVGLDNAGKTAILDNGLKATSVSMTAEDLEQAGATQMSIVAISNYTGVPVSKLGGGGRSYASQEQEDQAFVNDGLDFYFNVFEDEASSKLLTDEERAAGYEVKANREALLRPATRDKFEVLRIATAGKPIMTQNEARKQIDLPPAEEEGADELGTPLNMGQGGIDNQPNDPASDGPGRPESEDPPPETGGELAEARRAAMVHATKKMVKRVAFHANRAAKDGSRFMAFVAELRVDHRAVFRSEFGPAEQVAGVKPGEAADYLLETLILELNTVAGEATEKTLAAKVAALTADQAVRLPKELVHIFLEDSEAVARPPAIAQPVVNVNVAKPDPIVVNVSVPKPDVPVINVQVPEARPPIVNVQVPDDRGPKTKTAKKKKDGTWEIREE